jgi:DNA-binding NarL/FixJ family response regulator
MAITAVTEECVQPGFAEGRSHELPLFGNRFGLTKRELEVVQGVLRADSNRKIAHQLSIAEATVKHHLANIFVKVGVPTRLQLAVFAMRHRLTAEGPRM